MWRVAPSFLISRVAVHPSMTGRLMSIRIRSGASLRAMDTPDPPSTAMTTAYPLRSSRRDSMSRFISLSSTSRILAMPSPSRSGPVPIGRLGAPVGCGRDQGADLGEQRVQVRRALLEDDLDRSGEPLPLLRGHVLGGQYDDGQAPPIVRGAQLRSEGEPVHLRHHEVEEDEGRAPPRHRLQAEAPVLGLLDLPAVALQGP